jgi:hypothetical protein
VEAFKDIILAKFIEMAGRNFFGVVDAISPFFLA